MKLHMQKSILNGLKADLLKIEKEDIVTIIGHNDIPLADGDALSSTKGLAVLLGKYHGLQNVHVRFAQKQTLSDTVKKFLEYQSKHTDIVTEFYLQEQFKDAKFITDYLIVCDTDFERTGFNKDQFQVNKGMFVLDHHAKEQQREDFKEMLAEDAVFKNYVFNSSNTEFGSASTSQLVLLLASMWSGTRFKDDGEELFMVTVPGILTDTGCFEYSGSSNAMQIISEFCQVVGKDWEIPQSDISNLTSVKWKSEDLSLISKIYNEIGIIKTQNGPVGFHIQNQQEMYREDGSYAAYSIVYLIGNFDTSAAITAMIKKLDDGRYEIMFSLRSVFPELNCRTFATKHEGGGGHIQAAGFELYTEPDADYVDAERIAQDKIDEFIDYIGGLNR